MEKGNIFYHKLDRFVGIPIVFILGLLRNKRKTIPAPIKRIAVLNLVSIGDNVLMSGPMVDLRAQHPAAFICVFTGSTNEQIVRLIPGIDQIVQLPITNPWKVLLLLRHFNKFDILLDFGAWPRLSSIYSFFLKSVIKIGFKSEKQFRHNVYDIAINYSGKVHEIENYRSLIEPICKLPIFHNPTINHIKTEKIVEFISTIGKYCIIHTWSGGLRSKEKQWDNQNWAGLVSKISYSFNTIILIGSPGDVIKNKELLQAISKVQVNCLVKNVAGAFNLGETSFLLKNATCIICIDSGISHMAAASGTPMICLQGPANSTRWRPYRSDAVVINPNKGEFGYLSFGFEKPKIKESAMDNISIEKVFNEFLNFKISI